METLLLSTQEAQDKGFIKGWELTQQISDGTWTVSLGGMIHATKCADLFVAVLAIPSEQRGEFTKERILALAEERG